MGERLRVSVALGYGPRSWRVENVIFIPKAGKEDFSIAKSFRLFRLTPLLIKTLENTIDGHLTSYSYKVSPA